MNFALRDAVTSRRVQLRMTKAELARRSRLTRSTIHEIETGIRKSLQPATYAQLDEALGWEIGTLDRLSHPKPSRVHVEARSRRESSDVAFAEERLRRREDAFDRYVLQLILELKEDIAERNEDLVAIRAILEERGGIEPPSESKVTVAASRTARRRAPLTASSSRRGGTPSLRRGNERSPEDD